MNALKIVIVGDSEVGKTWLMSRAQELYATLQDYFSLLRKPFDHEVVYSPTVFETCFTNVDTAVLGNYQTNIWDTGGCAIFNFIRPLAYIHADVFILCFDISNRESFCSVTERWLPELQNYQPNTPILLVGTKADLRDEDESFYDLVSICEAQNLAESLGCLYKEVSAQTGDQVADAFESAVKLGHAKRKEEGSLSQKRSNTISNSFDPTWIPPMKSPPIIRIEPSTYVNDFKKVLEDTANADVLFKFEDGSPNLSAHKIMLWLTPSIFKDVLHSTNFSNFEKFKDLFKVTDIGEDIQPLLNDTDLKNYPQVRTCILFKNWISWEIFVKILEFFYTGETGISKDTEQSKVEELLTASEKLEVQSLVEVCNYFLKLARSKKDDEQKSKTPDPADKKLVQPMQQSRSCIVNDLFLDKQATTFSDVTFLVDDTLVCAHKAILVARSSFIAALLSENFMDGKSSQVHLQGIDCLSFLAILEYLYTDRCTSLERISVEDVLILADQFCLSRLVQICEAHKQKELQQTVFTKASHYVANEFMDALALSKMFNANQLTEWCLHFIAFNFTSFKGIGKELDLIVKENKEFIEEHRWPPQEYVQALEEYKHGAYGIKAIGKRLRQTSCSCLPHKCRIM